MPGFHTLIEASNTNFRCLNVKDLEKNLLIFKPHDNGGGRGVAYPSGTFQLTPSFYLIGARVTHALVLHVVFVLFI